MKLITYVSAVSYISLSLVSTFCVNVRDNFEMAESLRGKLTLVTGAGSGIGEALCQVLLREGSKVAAVDIKAIDPDKYAGAKDFKEFRADISSKDEVEELVKNVQTHFGSAPDCIVNCAGIGDASGFLTMTEKQFDDVIRVNLKGTYLVCQAATKALVENQEKNKSTAGGSIVNISSIVGRTGFIGNSNYSASKAGVIGLTKTIAKELSQYCIRCNAVLPGFIETPMTSGISEEVKKNFIKEVPLGRIGKPEEVAELCVFLLSDKSSYITGTSIEITGGWYM